MLDIPDFQMMAEEANEEEYYKARIAVINKNSKLSPIRKLELFIDTLGIPYLNDIKRDAKRRELEYKMKSSLYEQTVKEFENASRT